MFIYYQIHRTYVIIIAALFFEDYEFSFEAEKAIVPSFIEGILTWYELVVWRSVLYLVSIPTTFHGNELPQVEINIFLLLSTKL